MPPIARFIPRHRLIALTVVLVIKRVVDRRFNRAPYDAERIVKQFSGRLRDELDLATLAGELQRTSVAAVEPVASAAWLRASGAR